MRANTRLNCFRPSTLPSCASHLDPLGPSQVIMPAVFTTRCLVPSPNLRDRGAPKLLPSRQEC